MEQLTAPCKLLKVIQLPLLSGFKQESQEIELYPMLLFVTSFMSRWEDPTVLYSELETFFAENTNDTALSHDTQEGVWKVSLA